jgi:hypothetical protein
MNTHGATASGTPVKFHLAPWVDVQHHGCGLGFSATVDVEVHRALDWVLRSNLSDATGNDWATVNPVAFERFAVDFNVLDNAMGGDEGQGGEDGENESGGGLHVEKSSRVEMHTVNNDEERSSTRAASDGVRKISGEET